VSAARAAVGSRAITRPYAFISTPDEYKGVMRDTQKLFDSMEQLFILVAVTN